MNNRETLDNLFETKQINLTKGRLFNLDIQSKNSGFDFDRIEGMLLGIAIGDSLGNTTESLRPEIRLKKYGEIRDLLISNPTGYIVNRPSDDTQMSFWLLELLLIDGSLNIEHLAQKFANEFIFGMGRSVSDFRRNYKRGQFLYECATKSAGNGALMRIAPIIVEHLNSTGTDLWVDTALAATVTHNDRASNSACLAFVAMLWELLDMTKAPEKKWWYQRYIELAKDLEGDTHYSPRGGQFQEYSGSLWKFIEEKLPEADTKKLTTLEACNTWYSGAYLMETMPSVLYILMQHAHDPEEAIVRAVNDTVDNDTIASIVGAAVGALHGKKGLPNKWIDNLSGRLAKNDNGKVFELLEAAKQDKWLKSHTVNK